MRNERGGLFGSDLAPAMDYSEALLALIGVLLLLAHLVTRGFALAIAHIAPRILVDATLMHIGGLTHPRRPLTILM